MNVDVQERSVSVVCGHCQTAHRVDEAYLAQARCGACGRPMFDGSPVELSGVDLERHIAKSALPVVADFWAPWCAPCRMMAPAFARAARELGARYRLAKLNTDNEQALATRLNIRGIPTFVIFKGGKEVARTSGAMDAAQFIDWVRANG